MPLINGHNVYISTDFDVPVPGAPDSQSTPQIVDKVDYSAYYEIVGIITNLLTDTNTSEFLGDIPQDIYITSGDLNPNYGNGYVAAWIASVLANTALTTAPTDTFRFDVPTNSWSDPDGSGPNPPVATKVPDSGLTPYSAITGTYGFIDIELGVMANTSQTLQFIDPSGTVRTGDLQRTIFHELAHAQTRDVNKLGWQVSSTISTPSGTATILNFTVAEAIAIDAENLVYRQSFGGDIRVGHDPGAKDSNNGTLQSNDPTGGFKSTGKISFVLIDDYDLASNEVAIMIQAVDPLADFSDTIEKIYGKPGFSVTTPSATYALNNYILLDAYNGDDSDSGILQQGGVASDLLSTLLGGLAQDSAATALEHAGDQIDRLNDLGQVLQSSTNPSLTKLQDVGALLEEINYTDLDLAIGMSDETSITDTVAVGPYIGTTTPAGELYIEAVDLAALVIGASGAYNSSVDEFDYRDRTDYLRGSDGNDFLLAGVGAVTGKFNILEGKDGDDILIGRTANDQIFGGSGDDVIFLSQGQDVIDGGVGLDTLVVDDSLGEVTIDLNNKPNGLAQIITGSAYTELQGIELYVGNASTTTFKGDGSGAVFVAGSGGGIFDLAAGDQGIGYTGVNDVFNVHTIIPPEIAAKLTTDAQRIEYLERNKVIISNFEAGDTILVNGAPFTGNRVTSALSGQAVAGDYNRDSALNSYVLSGDSSYGTSYAATTYAPLGISWGGETWGQLAYSGGEYRDVTYSVDSDGIGIINLFSRGTTATIDGASSYFAGDAGLMFNALTASDEQLSIVIDGFQNGYGGIVFENDGVANLRPNSPDEGLAWTQNFQHWSWDEEFGIPIDESLDVLDGTQDGFIAPGGPTVDADDPLFNFGDMPYNWTYWDEFLLPPQNLQASDEGDELEGGWANDTLTGGNGDDFLWGGPGDDILDGGAGNDELWGDLGDDTLIGGTGDDLLYGDAGHNTLDGGDGTDVALYDGAASDFRVYRDLQGTVFVESLYGDPQDTLVNVESLYFRYTEEEIAVDDLPMGTSGNDILIGSERADLLDGGTGDDEMTGGAGDDIYVVDSASDVVVEYADEGLDTVRTSLLGYTLGADVENLVFIGTGSFTGTGNALDNYIVGGASDDILAGADGDDLFATGGGNDTIDGGDGFDGLELAGQASDYAYSADGLGGFVISHGTETIELTDVEFVNFGSGSSYLLEEIVSLYVSGTSGNDALVEGDDENNTISGLAGDDNLRGNGGANLIDGGDGDDTALFDGSSTDYEIFYNSDGWLVVGDLGGWSYDALFNVEHLHFDGDNATVSVSALAPLGTSGNDTITGSALNERLYGFAGDDVLSGGGGNDMLRGDEGNDTLQGGTGDDAIFDQSGNDTYVYELGDGQDTISDQAGLDKIVFGPGISPGDVSLVVNNDDDLIISIVGGGQITVQGGFLEGQAIEEIHFDDLTVWDPWARLLASTSGDDVIIGTSAGDTIDGGAGHDTINGRLGNDILSGGTGNDQLTGAGGDDTYLFGLGDGVDVISEYNGNESGGSGGDDELVFGAGIVPADVQVTLSGSGGSFILSIIGTSDKVTLLAALEREVYSVETVRFADNTVWTATDLLSMAQSTTSGNDTLYGTFAHEEISGGAGNDTIKARGGDDILIGGTGNDTLQGSDGSDIYRFDLGDGQDLITDYPADDPWAVSVDAIEFGAGIDPDDIVVSQADSGYDLVLSIAGTSDKITIDNAAFLNDYRIEEVRFSDDTIWSHEDLMTRAFGPRSAGDSYWGTSLADVISGGDGNDTIDGRGGNDTLSGDDGNDTITGGSGNDYIDGGLGSDIAKVAGNMSTYSFATVNGHLQITDNSSADGYDGTDTLVGIETVQFKNGSTSVSSPVVLDLDGDGVSLVGRESSHVRFDWNGDGRKDRTGWIDSGDGFLALDRDGNGRISGANELSFIDDKPGAKSDLDGLSAFDSNGDGVLSAADEQFAKFGIWQDANGNGRNDPGEFRSLTTAGIASISLAGAAVNREWGLEENITINTGSFTRSNGSVGALSDVALNYAPGRSSAGAHSSNGLAPTGSSANDNPVTKHTQDLPRAAVTGSARHGHALTDLPEALAKQLALMRQDMGSFAAVGGELFNARRFHETPLDWHA